MTIRFAITGANGQLGSYLVKYLRAKGHIVYEWVRNIQKASHPDYYQFFDMNQPEHMSSLQNIDVLIHTAYFFNTQAQQYEKINQVATEKLFAQAKLDQVKYSIYISSLSAHAKASSKYGKLKFQLEQTLRALYPNLVILRPGLIFHQPLQGITAAMDNFVKKFPVVPLIGSGKQLIYPCLLSELSALIYWLALNQPTVTEPIIAAAEQPITFKQLVKYLAKQRGKSVLLLPIPFYLIYVLLKMLERIALSPGLRSDSLLGLQYGNSDVDFTAAHQLPVSFSTLPRGSIPS